MNAKKWFFCFSLLTMLILAVAAPIAHATGWTIMMWYGSPDELEDGWQLCDGSNGSPDLQNRYVVGVGTLYELGETGGALETDVSHSHQVDSHRHTISSVDLAHTHSVPAHQHTISSIDLAHTHSVPAHQHTISSQNLAHTHSVPAHTHTIANSGNLPHTHALIDHQHSIADANLAHTHYLAEGTTFSSKEVGTMVGYVTTHTGMKVYNSAAGSYTFKELLRYTQSSLTTHNHGGYTGNVAGVIAPSPDGNVNHNHGGSTGSWNGTTGSGLTTHDHGGNTGSWNGTTGSGLTTHSHGGNTGYASPSTDVADLVVTNEPPYLAVHYICYSGTITITPPITTAMAITDPNTTQYYTTTYGTKYAVYRVVTTGEQTIGYSTIAVAIISALQLLFMVIARRVQR